MFREPPTQLGPAAARAPLPLAAAAATPPAARPTAGRSPSHSVAGKGQDDNSGGAEEAAGALPAGLAAAAVAAAAAGAVLGLQLCPAPPCWLARLRRRSALQAVLPLQPSSVRPLSRWSYRPSLELYLIFIFLLFTAFTAVLCPAVLQRAQEIERAEPKVAYYCRMYALEQVWSLTWLAATAAHQPYSPSVPPPVAV